VNNFSDGMKVLHSMNSTDPSDDVKNTENYSYNFIILKKIFTSTIISWFNGHSRKFPWREEKDPFKILMAEVMLQRTRAEQVKPVYLKFIKRFNDIDILCCADIGDVSNYLKNLGLIRRSKLIISMACFIINEFHGVIPSSKTDLLKIPCIGDYTADAVRVFAFNQRLTVIDSNVIRVVSRFFGFLDSKVEMRRNRKFKEFCLLLAEDLDKDEIRNFNWGLIDFSAIICKSVPRCNFCPLSDKCDHFRRINNLEIIR